MASIPHPGNTPSTASGEAPDDRVGDDSRDVVLYVEDHPVNVLLMQTVFELRPALRLIVAVDGSSAMAQAAHLSPSLLLLDLRLPDCHGTQLLERMRLLPGWENIPAIAVTAEAEFIRDGTTFCDVWHKPLRVPTLLARLDRYLVPPGAPNDDGTTARATAGASVTPLLTPPSGDRAVPSQPAADRDISTRFGAAMRFGRKNAPACS